jgi:hypothetical protein
LPAGQLQMLVIENVVLFALFSYHPLNAMMLQMAPVTAMHVSIQPSVKTAKSTSLLVMVVRPLLPEEEEELKLARYCVLQNHIQSSAGARFTNFQELFLTRILNAILNRLRIDS